MTTTPLLTAFVSLHLCAFALNLLAFCAAIRAAKLLRFSPQLLPNAKIARRRRMARAFAPHVVVALPYSGKTLAQPPQHAAIPSLIFGGSARQGASRAERFVATQLLRQLPIRLVDDSARIG